MCWVRVVRLLASRFLHSAWLQPYMVLGISMSIRASRNPGSLIVTSGPS